MELSKGANECIVQAQMLRMSTGKENGLNVEHLLYGLLVLSKYLDPPICYKPEFEHEGKAVRSLLNKHIKSIESAAWQLKKEAGEDTSAFLDATLFLGRASEIAESAGKNEISAECLAQAIFEKPTPVITALKSAYEDKYAAEDEKYSEMPSFEQPNSPKEVRAKKPDNALTPSQVGVLLEMLAAKQDAAHEELKQSMQKPEDKKQKRRTKLGLFTYPGGAVAAAIQYFLYGIFVPLAVLAGLEILFDGVVTRSTTPFVDLLVSGFIFIWIFYLLRGINKLIGLKCKSFGFFLDIISYCTMFASIALVYQLSYGFAEMPEWLRIVLCIIILLTLMIGSSTFKRLKNEGDITKTKIMFKNFEGTPGMVFFRFLTGQLIFPFIVFSIFWIFRIEVALWFEKTFYIFAFLWVWNIIFTMWNCITLKIQNSAKHRKGEFVVRFLGSQHILLLLPGFVLYLYWLFDWFPMETWVIVLYCIFGLFWLKASVESLIHIEEDLGNGR